MPKRNWLIPAGPYERVANEAIGRDVPVPGTYHLVESNPQSWYDVLMAPIRGFYDPVAGRANAIDVDAVYADWGTPQQHAINRASPEEMSGLTLAEGSMRPKVEAACDFVTAVGGMAGIGTLTDALKIIERNAGTVIS